MGSGTTGLIVSNKEIKVFMKIVKALEESGLLIKSVTQANGNETKLVFL